MLGICLARLLWIQAALSEQNREIVSNIGIAPPRELPTLRGMILDRRGRPMAQEIADFKLCLLYRYIRLKDEKFWLANALFTAQDRGISPEDAIQYWHEELADELERTNELIAEFLGLPGITREIIETNLSEINSRIWRLREFFAMKRNFPNTEMTLSDYRSIPEEQRLIMEAQVNDLAEMHTQWHCVADINEQAKNAAQIRFIADDDVGIDVSSTRSYPFDETAAHIIGWVNPAQPDKGMFSSDELMKYKEGELAGFTGVEYVFEPLLRGRRGKVTYLGHNGEKEVIASEFGMNVNLTIDAVLQERIEDWVSNPQANKNSSKPTGIVIIDAATGEILASVSTPSYNLNKMRADFTEIKNSPNSPLKNRAMYSLYPPGSSIKPTILLAGMEEGKVTQHSIISCPPVPEENWPRCLLQRNGSCHDWRWQYEGGNNARNAIRGSCNIYFTKLAHRIESEKLQRWLYDIGFGRRILADADLSYAEVSLEQSRGLQESQGIISGSIPQKNVKTFEDLPPLPASERKWFGMGQGNLRVTVLQVANSMALIARGGVFIQPTLYRDKNRQAPPKQLGIADNTIETIKDGMSAVVYETGGTANTAYKESGFDDDTVELFGKTGSTEAPANAWFVGFAQDSRGRSVAIAVVIEGGLHGSSDAAPIAFKSFEILREEGYIGEFEDGR
ncbi:Beta-lactam-inducible penicillin-binding protein [Limihaloglobus sulfuriphilus]|uniref:beta-lactamase n=2 Tax=Limihaloglobus sulfuriphilus TaxID=1851148 RepID=A0A1Q2MF20_9BACT|nr:Beta-lactam-inducible penicillin-binding protein [Limihaloglobus sulfuriphilus]